MLKSRMKYGAIAAKVMTMYGRLLKDEDWRRLYECRSVSDIYGFLRNHRGWSETVMALPASSSPKVLQMSIRKTVYRDYEKLYNFSNLEDKKYLRFIIYQSEYELILEALREKRSYERLSEVSVITDFMRRHSSVDIEALSQSKSFSDILNAVKGSIYEKPLSELKINPETGMPSYWEAGVFLENVYYKSVFSFLQKKYKGLGKKRIEEIIGSEADLLNIVSIIRLHRNFPTSLERADELLIPVSYRLKPDFLHSLETAKSEDEALDLLRKSPFGQRFEGVGKANIENLYYKYMEELCIKLVKSFEPDLGVAQAYLVLKELECKKLLRVIEAIDSGIDPKTLV